MGRYIDWADVANRYSEISKIAGAEQASSYWINYVEADLDARLASRYTTPFSIAPDVVKDLAIDMTFYRMTIRQKGSEIIKAFIDERVLGLINGTINIDGATTQQAVAWSEQNVSGYHTAFGPDDELNWTPSSAYLADVDDQRQ